MVTKRTCGLPLICLICGDAARGINFNVMSCMSCKTFFRRHVLKSKLDLQCQIGNNCKITVETRGICSACRLKKCFALGMNPKLVGHRLYKQTISNHIRYLKMMNKQKNLLPQPLTLSLLQNDRSTLTINEWDLLSNIIHAYDSINIISQSKYLLEQQSSLPPKIRSKPSTIFGVVKYFFSLLQPLLERTPYFHELSTDAYCKLIRHNLPIFGTLNTTFIMREINALDYSAYITGLTTIYGDEAIADFKNFIITLEQNGIFIKIMLLILAFSTNCSVVLPDYDDDMTSISSSILILSIQNVFITMFWKYLIYQFGFLAAVQWFNHFIKYVLDIIQSSGKRQHAQHNDLLDEIIEETTHSLTIEY